MSKSSLRNLYYTSSFILTFLGTLILIAQPASANPQLDVSFEPKKAQLVWGTNIEVNFTITVNQSSFKPEDLKSENYIRLRISPLTLAPQFDIIEIEHKDLSQHRTNQSDNIIVLDLPIETLQKNAFTYKSTLILKPTYIGHATLKLDAILSRRDEPDVISLKLADGLDKFKVIIIRHEGLLDKIFMYSVIVFITISYINLGAQIETENVKRLIETPRIILWGFLVGSSVMPLGSWIAGHVFFPDQPMYRIGSFIYACGPAASASVLWTVLFDADKELALGLQIASTIGALFTMPIFLYAIDQSIDLERQYTIKVPYMNLARTLIVLLVALLVGHWLVGTNKRIKQISQRIFRPLTMFVLLFIIIFSSIVYWYIYRMFDWNITAMAICVTITTYIVSGLLGFLLHRDLNHMITISISSTYRNSGIAFAALVVAFQPPDIFIAYVPCLTQVVTTSVIGLVLYSIKSLKSCYDKKQQDQICET